MNSKRRIILVFLATFILTPTLYGFTYQAHQNLAEDALIYMELHGSNQMRWAYAYLKAKANGRLYQPGQGSPSDICFDYNDPSNEGSGWQNDVNSDGQDDRTGSDSQCGIMGIGRSGAIAPDYFRDNFWYDTTSFNYAFSISGLTNNNFTSWSHFINLLTVAENGTQLITSNFNDHDGYSFQANYGFPSIGIDYVVGTYMNDAWLTTDLPNCTQCSSKYTLQPSGNPAIDYRQNGSTTPVKSAGNGGYKSANTNGDNYNCFADGNLPGTSGCRDEGMNVNGQRSSCGWLSCSPPSPYPQWANTYPGGQDGNGNATADYEDWIVYEPADNTSTFFYNEMFLEGGSSRTTSPPPAGSAGTLQTTAVTGRYYTIPGDELKFLATIMHWAGDMNQQTHIWSTIGYNHGQYETRVDDIYGFRLPFGTAIYNWEDSNKMKAYANSRIHGHNSSISQIYMEQAFHTYNVRLRGASSPHGNHDTMTNTSNAVRDRAGAWAVNNSAAIMSILYEKAVMDLRKYRQ